VFTAPLPAQKDGKIQYLEPDKVERATAPDDKGQQQWSDWKPENCPNCNGNKTVDCPHCAHFADNKKCPECNMTKKAPCRACAGLGTVADPLDKMLCPECLGAGQFQCATCEGRGISKVNGSGDKIFDCVACRGEGGYKCAICNGTRLVEAAAIKPSLRAATNAAVLTKAKEQVDAALKQLATFEPDGKNSRKDVKEFTKVLAPLAPLLPPIKREQKAVEDVMGKIYAGSVYEGHEEKEANALKMWRAHTEYYLKLNRRMLELSIKRAEQNAGGEKKE